MTSGATLSSFSEEQLREITALQRNGNGNGNGGGKGRRLVEVLRDGTPVFEEARQEESVVLSSEYYG